MDVAHRLYEVEGEVEPVPVPGVPAERSLQFLPCRSIDCRADLERDLGRSVDLVALNLAPEDLAIRVLRANVLLVDLDPSARIRFEVRTRNEFFDLEPHLRRYRRMETTP